MANHKYPKLIGIFGIDGSGKTTQINLLNNYLINQSFLAERPHIISVLREEAHRIAWSIGKKNAYELFDINTLSICGALEVLKYVQGIISNRNINRYILFDKYVDAFKAVASVNGLEDFSRFNLVLNQFPPLDHQFYLKININQTVKRIKDREGGNQYNEEENYLAKYKEEYDKLLLDDPKTVVLNAEKTQEELHKQIIDILNI